jgi:hypothetical protein
MTEISRQPNILEGVRMATALENYVMDVPKLNARISLLGEQHPGKE